MSNPKIILSDADLHSPQVEDKLKQQAAVESAQASYRDASNRPSRLSVPDDEGGSFWYNTVVNMTIFGLIGGVLAFGLGETIKYFNPDLYAQAQELLRGRTSAMDRNLAGTMDSVTYKLTLAMFDEQGRNNPYYRIDTDDNLSLAQKQAAITEQEKIDDLKTGYSNLLFYCACGVMMAIALGMADTIATRNVRGAIVYGSVGAALGLVGGFIVSLYIDTIFQFLAGQASGHAATARVNLGRVILARSLCWGVLGMFFSAAPGIVMRNARKLTFGVAGGLIGGVLGGALFDPVARFLRSDTQHLDWVSRLVAILAIGVITGVGTGLIENAAKLGWLKVVEGLIAGKQFILYRNPSFIGSSPQCEVYLFRDNQVLRRHAAVHMVPGGYEIEDLGTTRTLVNGRAVRRLRLHSGDRIQIGRSCFAFHEKVKTLE